MRGAESKLSTGEAFSFLNTISVCGLALTVIFIFDKYNNEDILKCLENYGIQLSVVLLTATLVYIKRPFMEFERFRFGVFLSLGITLFLSFLLQNNAAVDSNPSLYFGITLFWTLAVALYCLQYFEKVDINRFQFAFVPFSYGLLFSGLSLEVFNILNQHSIFVVNRLSGAKIVFAVTLVLAVVLFVFANTKPFEHLKTLSYWETVSIIGLLLSLYYFTAIPPLQISAGTELFEQANHGMLVNDFIAWGRFPMVNSFDAHTLSYSMGMIIYGVLNGDLLGASYYDYSFVWLLPMAICMFLVYKNVFDKSFAFFFMIIAPQISTLEVNMGVISVIALLYAVKKQTLGAYLWLFFSIAIGLIYSIPTGFAYGGATVLIAVVFLIVPVFKERRLTVEATSFLKAFGIFLGTMLALWTGICLQQNIHPVKRALEFLSIAQSTNNWTYASLGGNTTITFSLLYSILPLAVVACLIWLVTHFKKDAAHIASCAFLLVYVMNITRSLQRHSLAENRADIIISTAILGIALFAVTLLPKQNRGVLIVLGAFIATAIFHVEAIPHADSLTNSAITAVNNPGIYYNGATEKITRVNLSAPFDTHRGVINMINTVIPEGETFFDLTGQSMLYALTGREKPVYANQSVTELSGTYSQKRAIEEVEDYNGTCDFVLMNRGIGYNLDGLSSFYRYYYVYEYLYENYRPLCISADDFALWVRKDRYEAFPLEEIEKEYATIPLNINTGNAVNGLAVLSTTPLVLQCFDNDKDPFITFPLSLPAVDSPGNGMVLKIKYKSTVGGMCQVFFDFAGFNETDSSISSLIATEAYEEAYFTIPVREPSSTFNIIRLDPPGGSTFEIASMNIVSIPAGDFTSLMQFEQPIYHSDLTDHNWTDGILNGNPNQMIFLANDAHEIANAKVLYSAEGSANVTDVIVDSDWIRLTVDQDAGIFSDGIIAADLYSGLRIKPIDFDYLGLIHSMDLGQVPYVWGQYDIKKAWENSIVSEYVSSSGELSDEVQKTAKYAVCKIDAPEDGNAMLSLQNMNGENIANFNFSLLKGSNRYIIRVSTDWWWNNGVIKSFTISEDVGATIHKVQFLVGD